MLATLASPLVTRLYTPDDYGVFAAFASISTILLAINSLRYELAITLPGDDIKHLDWKHYARTDRLFTRVYRETTEWPVMLALDVSRSMRMATPGGPTKMRVAAVLAAALSYLLVQQGEAVGLVAQAG